MAREKYKKFIVLNNFKKYLFSLFSSLITLLTVTLSVISVGAAIDTSTPSNQVNNNGTTDFLMRGSNVPWAFLRCTQSSLISETDSGGVARTNNYEATQRCIDTRSPNIVYYNCGSNNQNGASIYQCTNSDDINTIKPPSNNTGSSSSASSSVAPNPQNEAALKEKLEFTENTFRYNGNIIEGGQCDTTTNGNISICRTRNNDGTFTNYQCQTTTDTSSTRFICDKIIDSKVDAGTIQDLGFNESSITNQTTTDIQEGNGTTPSNSDSNFINTLISWVGRLLAFIIWIFVIVAKIVLGVMGGMFVVLVGVNPASGDLLRIAEAPWQSVISIANIILIAGVIFMGFGYILNLKAIKRDLKDFILGILIVGLLMQFTLAASTAVINAANGVGNIVYYSAGGLSSENASSASASGSADQDGLKACLARTQKTGNNFVDVFICNVSQISKFDSGVKNIISIADDEVNGELIAIAILLAILIMAILAFARVLFVLLIRIFGLWLLIVVSPLALVAAFSPLPMIKDFSKKWLDNFLKLAFAYPVFAFGITLVSLMIGSISEQIASGSRAVTGSGVGSQVSYDGSIVSSAQADQVGSGVASYAKNTFLDADTVAKIMAAVFAFGLVYLFGKMFWDVFAVFWQVAKQAAGTALAGSRFITGSGKALAGGALGLAAGLGDATARGIDKLGDTASNKGYGKLGSALKTVSAVPRKGIGGTARLAKRLSDFTFDSTRFAIDLPGGIGKFASSTWKGYQSYDNAMSRRNQNVIGALGELAFRAAGQNEAMNAREGSIFKGARNIRELSNDMNTLDDPKAILQKIRAGQLADIFLKDSAVKKYRAANDRLFADFIGKLDELSTDELSDVLDDFQSKYKNSVKEASPAEREEYRKIVDILSKRSNGMSRLVSDFHKNSVREIIDGLSEDSKNSIAVKNPQFMRPEEMRRAVRSMSQEDFKKMEPSALRDPEFLRTVNEELGEGTAKEWVSKSLGSAYLQEMYSVDSLKSGIRSQDAKQATERQFQRKINKNDLAQIGNLVAQSDSVQYSGTKDLFKSALKDLQIDNITGEVNPASRDKLRTEYDKILNQNFTNTSGQKLVLGKAVGASEKSILEATFDDMINTGVGGQLHEQLKIKLGENYNDSNKADYLRAAMFGEITAATSSKEDKLLAVEGTTKEVLTNLQTVDGEIGIADSELSALNTLVTSIGSVRDIETISQKAARIQSNNAASDTAGRITVDNSVVAEVQPYLGLGTRKVVENASKKATEKLIAGDSSNEALSRAAMERVTRQTQNIMKKISSAADLASAQSYYNTERASIIANINAKLADPTTSPVTKKELEFVKQEFESGDINKTAEALIQARHADIRSYSGTPEQAQAVAELYNGLKTEAAKIISTATATKDKAQAVAYIQSKSNSTRSEKNKAAESIRNNVTSNSSAIQATGQLQNAINEARSSGGTTSSPTGQQHLQTLESLNNRIN